MAIETLQKRIARLNQQKARLAQEENIIKEKSRKQRTRRLIELGGLLVKAKLDELENNTLYGALLSLSDELNNNPSKKEQFKSIGVDAFAKEQIDKTPVLLSFVDQPDKNTLAQIKELGLRWNKYRQEWYGETELEKLQSVVKDIEHKIIEVK